MAQYRIVQGVHRCVAARIAGLMEIPAVVDRGGSYGPVIVLPLDSLYSAKKEIGRWDRRRDFQVLVSMMADETSRAAMDPIIVAPLADTKTKYFTPIADVAVIE